MVSSPVSGSGSSSESKPFVKVEVSRFQVSTNARVHTDSNESTNSGESKRQGEGVSTTLGFPEVRLAQKMGVGLSDDLVSGVVGDGGVSVSSRVVLVDGTKAMSCHFI